MGLKRTTEKLYSGLVGLKRTADVLCRNPMGLKRTAEKLYSGLVGLADVLCRNPMGLKRTAEKLYSGLVGLKRTAEKLHSEEDRGVNEISVAENAGFYIGLERRSNPTRLEWHDGSLPATDMPLAGVGSRWGTVTYPGTIKMVSGIYEKYALCGNYNTPTMTEAYGTTVHGQEPVDKSFRLTESAASSYMECVVMCSQETLCRLADFRRDISTCTLLGPGTLDDTTENAASTTFIRASFDIVRDKYGCCT
ncbi:LOW QUALITY PROTEIN: Fdsig-like [Plakobranchus ocellatus]|uniref:Fdsig-like n=1 Tax=Plakobranchus ocellatus TaxID=259542 RepID=A0AAV3Z6W2_9GAST|nr:LOW QUALITY PROTEIN: Fdsig-like [Plakobranchus ocellatus]